MTNDGLAKAVEKDVKMKPDPKNDELNSRIATAAFNKHCKPK